MNESARVKVACERRTIVSQTRRDMLLMAGAGASAALGPAIPAFGQDSPVIYSNSFQSSDDIADWRIEGSAHLSSADGRMVMENARPPEDGQDANFVHWCPQEFPADFEASWRFRPLREPGLCVFLFGTMGMAGEDRISPWDPRIAPRQGVYSQYTDSDIEYLSISYFRRRWAPERALHVTNMRYAPGFELLATGPDPLPNAEAETPLNTIRVRKQGRNVTFFVDQFKLLDWTAPDGRPMPGRGYMGFRQMAPLKAEYADFEVRALNQA